MNDQIATIETHATVCNITDRRQANAPVKQAKMELWPLSLIVLLGAAVRIAGVNSHSFWYDEAAAAQISSAPLLDLFRGTVRDNGNPPLYWMLEHIWGSMFGYTEIALRSLPLCLGILAIPILAFLGWHLFNAGTGFLAAALFAISPIALELSNEARPYALLHLLGLLSTLQYVLWVRYLGKLRLALYAIFTFLCCYCHYYGFVIPISHGLILMFTRDQRYLAKWMVAMAGAAILWLPWLANFAAQVATPGNLSRMKESWTAQFIVTPLVFGEGRTLVWRESPHWLLGMGILVALVIFWMPVLWWLHRTFHNWLKRPRRLSTDDPAWAPALLATILLLPIIGPLVVALTGHPLYHHRYGSVAIWAFLLLVSAAYMNMRVRTALLFLALVTIVTMVSVIRYFLFPLKDDWRSAVPAVIKHMKPGETVMFDTDIEVTSFKYYANWGNVMPQLMVGITKPPSSGNDRIQGVRYFDGLRINKDAEDCSGISASAQGVWLCLCVPTGKFDSYQKFFDRRGFSVSTAQHFYRIDVYHFERSGAPLESHSQ
jgi:4-amino-4-deoxy-L-arabinose transferase-like glycosyltransferase